MQRASADHDHRTAAPQAIVAGFCYFVAAFLLGLALAPVRILLLEPRIGEVAAVFVELPIMLGWSWLACGWLMRWLDVPGRTAPALLMGGVAFLLLMLAELCVSLYAVHGSLGGHFGSYGQPHRLLGLVAQIAFALFPFIRARRR